MVGLDQCSQTWPCGTTGCTALTTCELSVDDVARNSGWAFESRKGGGAELL